VLPGSRSLQSSFDRSPGGGCLGDPFEDRPEVTLPKDWSEASAPVPALAQASRVQVPQAQVPQVQAPQVPVERLPVPAPAGRLLALVPGPVQELAPEEASAQVLGPEPELQPSAALALARGPRPCAHT
jgi:hypothetical protein